MTHTTTATTAPDTQPDPGTALLDRLLAGDPPAFALLHRPDSPTGPDRLDLLVGEVSAVHKLAELPLPDADPAAAPASQDTPVERHELVAIVPYRQVSERGFACWDDGQSILALSVRTQAQVSLDDVIRGIPDVPVALDDADFDVDDERYAETVRRVLAEEIGRGEGSNFVIKRAFTATIRDYSVRHALSVFRRLLLRETGAYWTFIVHTGSRTFIGATPERHVSLSDGTLMMNPISGTYRYPSSGPELSELVAFLSDRKEADELYMVVDEELKMMARLCDEGGRVVGPFLREMGQLAHTEYILKGGSSRDVRDILRETMFAPTVTGSPLENACRVIARHESRGRGYYSGAVALVGRDASGERTLDSSILIRTASVDASGWLEIGVGATLVRLSKPESEVAETRAKAAGMLAAFGIDSRTGGSAGPRPERRSQPWITAHPEVRAALGLRNATLARYWLGTEQPPRLPELTGRRVLVVDAEDTFTAMLALQLRSLGLRVEVRQYHEPMDFDGVDFVVVGPGPGDPRDLSDPKIAALREITEQVIRRGIPFLSVCLGHQVLSGILGLDLIRRSAPNQGVQIEIDYFGRPERVGFYNTFAARCDSDRFKPSGISGTVEVSRDPATGQVYALRGERFAALQFHPESLLTENGSTILRELFLSLAERDTSVSAPVNPALAA
ncbi:MAG TPA: anthranilate synthase family protein [Micromonosporaceae bacterium]